MRFALTTVALMLASGVASAQAVSFRHAATIYSDEKGGALRYPEGVGCGENGQLLVADTGNRRLLSYKLEGGSVSGGREIKLPEVTIPGRVDVAKDGRWLVLDRKNNRIARLDAGGAFVDFVEGSGQPGAGGLQIAGFKTDRNENLVLLDVAAGEVRVSDRGGKVLRVLELPKKGLFTDVAVDPAGMLFVVDALEATVWSAAPDSKAFRPLTAGMKGYMNFPQSMLAWRGRLFIVDTHGNGLVMLGQDGTFQGRQLSIGWSEGLLYYPTQLCIDGQGVALVADRNNHRVQLFTTIR